MQTNKAQKKKKKRKKTEPEKYSSLCGGLEHGYRGLKPYYDSQYVLHKSEHAGAILSLNAGRFVVWLLLLHFMR